MLDLVDSPGDLRRTPVVTLIIRCREGCVALELTRQEPFLERRPYENRQSALPQPVDALEKRIGIEQAELELHAIDEPAVDHVVNVVCAVERHPHEAHLA